MAKNEAKIKFSAETGDFNRQIKSANDEMSMLRAELKLNETQMKGTGSSVEGLENKHRILSNQLKASEDKTEALNQKVEKAVEIFGENSTEATKLKTQLLNAQNAEEKIRQEVDQCNKELKEQKEVTDKVDNSLEEVEGSAKKASDGFTVMKGVAVNLVTAGLEKIVDAAGEVIDAFNEVDEGADNVIKATGATGESADSLTQSFENVSSKIVGDFGDIGSTLGEVNTRFGYTGEELESCTEDFLRFSEITGVDGTEAVQSVSRALNDAGIPLDDYGTLLDQLAKAGQTSGIEVTTLADSLSENGSVMRAMGFDTAETVALLSQFELSGANSSVMLTGMKKAMANWADEGKNGNTEFAKLVEGVKDGSVSASDAIDVFGTKAGPMLVDAIKSGKFEYNDMLKTIKDSKGTTDNTFDELIDGGYEADLAAQNAKLALADVGDTVLTTVAPAFDDFVAVVKGMADGFSAAVQWAKEHQGVLAAVAAVIGIVTTAIVAYNVVQAIKTAMDAAQVTTVWALVSAQLAHAAAAMAAVAPYVLIVAAIAAVIAIIVLCVKNWDKIKEKITEVAKKVKEKVTEIKNQITEKLNAAKQKAVELFENIKKSITDKITAVKKKVTEIFNNIKNTITTVLNNVKSTVNTVWNGIKTAITTVVNAIKNVITTVWNAIKKAITTVVNAIKSTVSSVWNGIKNAITTAVNNIKSKVTSVFNSVKTTVSSIFNSVKSTASSVWNGIKTAISNAVTNAKTKVSSVFNSVKSTVSSIFNGIKSTASSVWNGIKNAMTSPIQTAKNTISGIISSIKSAFNGMRLRFPSISIPRVKLPHFSIRGKFSLDPPSIPKISVSWYKHGGIMTKPTIFGMNGSSLMAGGEAGPEAILPIDKLKDYIADTVEEKMNVVNLGALADAITKLADRDINLNINGRNFVKATVGDSDRVNGLRSSFLKRGLALD